MNLATYISGANMMGFLVAALFFARFWVRTRDGLFLSFAAAFAMMAVERICLAFLHTHDETLTWVYLIRFVAFLVIIFGVVRKNRSAEG